MKWMIVVRHYNDDGQEVFGEGNMIGLFDDEQRARECCKLMNAPDSSGKFMQSPKGSGLARLQLLKITGQGPLPGWGYAWKDLPDELWQSEHMRYLVTKRHGAPHDLYDDRAIVFLMEQYDKAVKPEYAAHNFRRFRDWLVGSEKPLRIPPDKNWYVEIDANTTKPGSLLTLEFYKYGEDE